MDNIRPHKLQQQHHEDTSEASSTSLFVNSPAGTRIEDLCGLHRRDISAVFVSTCYLPLPKTNLLFPLRPHSTKRQTTPLLPSAQVINSFTASRVRGSDVRGRAPAQHCPRLEEYWAAALRGVLSKRWKQGWRHSRGSERHIL